MEEEDEQEQQHQEVEEQREDDEDYWPHVSDRLCHEMSEEAVGSPFLRLLSSTPFL